jgi:hypothetical protein
MTLGLTQPLSVGDPTFPWEFAIRTREQASWPVDLLYQLTTHWLDEHATIGFGHHLAFRFFYDRGQQLQAGIAPPDTASELVGDIAGLYLWLDELRLTFKTTSAPFGLLSVVGVTLDEDQLADDSTPAHVMLLLRRLGVSQVCDPYRKSVLSTQLAVDEWNRIKHLNHDQVLAMLLL